VIVGALCVVVHACAQQLPGAPSATTLLTISGYVYQQETPELGEPALADVLITVQETEGFVRTAQTDGMGFYTVSLRAGTTISITASKVGYTTRSSTVDLSKSAVLNFSLTPNDAPRAARDDSRREDADWGPNPVRVDAPAEPRLEDHLVRDRARTLFQPWAAHRL
jgi:hypothetical protein